MAFTDDDCQPAATWLTTLEARFVRFPEAAISGNTLNTLSDNPYAAASQLLNGWNRNRPDVPRPNLLRQCDKAGIDILHPAFAPPVALGRKVDDIARIRQLTGLGDEHSPWLHLVPLAGRSVGFVVLLFYHIRAYMLKLKVIPSNPMNSLKSITFSLFLFFCEYKYLPVA